MPKPLRTFIAVRIRATRPLRDVLDQLKTFGRSLKTVYPDNLHATLKFLGDTDPAAISEIGRTLEQAVAGVSPFELRMTGLGAFPDEKRPRVVWAGLERAEPLVALAAELETRLEPLGFPAEGRPFKPHLTLARLRGRPPEGLPALLAEHPATDFGTMSIDSIELYQSDLGTHGPKYTPLLSAELGT